VSSTGAQSYEKLGAFDFALGDAFEFTFVSLLGDLLGVNDCFVSVIMADYQSVSSITVVPSGLKLLTFLMVLKTMEL
jgi:hypothetical protein